MMAKSKKRTGIGNNSHLVDKAFDDNFDTMDGEVAEMFNADNI